MIITRRNGSLFLVSQNDHGRLAGELCAHWGNERFRRPEPAGPVRLAADLHDEGWRRADAEVLFNAQAARPLHFLEIRRDEHVALYRHGVETALDRDLYAALLVSMHWTGLYRSRWGLQGGSVFIESDNAIAQLQNEVVAAEEHRWIELKRAIVQGGRRSDFEAGLWHNYELLQTYDVMSLYMCTSPLELVADGDPPRSVVSGLGAIDQQPGPRTVQSVPVRAVGERVDIVLSVIEPGVVAVDPYPFGEDRLQVGVDARVIPDRRYISAEDAAQAVAAATAVRIECQLRRP